MNRMALLLIAFPAVMAAYAFVGYPLLLELAGLLSRNRPLTPADPDEWPTVTISLPAYNEEARIRETIESLLALDYPEGRLHILVISDASTDRTDEIVKSFADRGVQLLRLPERGGKTAAENAATGHLWGDVVVNTDASIRILPGSLKSLVRVFSDPEIGLASGRDVSVGLTGLGATRTEASYVSYEMWVRSLETRVGSIVGASGCFYAIRTHLHRSLFPEALSRDFASSLGTRREGYRSVSVDQAVCMVPRSGTLGSEFRRKLRTMARGLDTLWFERDLMNPFRYGGFALMLFSHKLCRWLIYLGLPFAAAGLVWLAPRSPLALGVSGLALFGVTAGLVALLMERKGNEAIPKPLALCGYLLVSTVAGVLAWVESLRGTRNPIWEPTRRPAAATPVDEDA